MRDTFDESYTTFNPMLPEAVGDAMHIRNTVLRRLARIELESDAALRRRLGHFIVVGGGFSGVEVAGELVDCLRSIRRYCPLIAPDELKVTVLQGTGRLLPELSPRLGLATTGGRIVVSGDLTVPGVAGLWALGDCACVPNAFDGKPCPPTAQIDAQPLRHFNHRSQGIRVGLGHALPARHHPPALHPQPRVDGR